MLLVLLFACHMTALASGHIPGRDVTTVAVTEGSDAILECLANPGKSLQRELFDWRKDEKTDEKRNVFMYNNGSHYNNGQFGQHQQFEGRVSHFPGQLRNGNASIIIRNTKIEDTGSYTCTFPFLQPQQQSCSVRLIVEPTFRDRSGEISGVALEPCVSIYNVSDSGVQLRCEARGAFPQPEVQWLDSDGHVLPAEEPEVVGRGGRFDITLHTTVKSTDGSSFRCVVKQEHFHHETGRNITVSEKLLEKTSREVDPGSCSSGVALGVVIGAVIGALLGQALRVAAICIRRHLKRGGRQPGNSPSAQPLKPEQNDQGSGREESTHA